MSNTTKITWPEQPLSYESRAAWEAEGKRRFGADHMAWPFVCPSCGHVATPMDWVKIGAPQAIGFSCVGRWMKNAGEAFAAKGKGPCNYAGGGLFKLNPIEVKGIEGRFFAFGEVQS